MQDGLVHTSEGNVQGARDGGVWAWLGLPYAKPPLGPLRFRAPEPPCPFTGSRPALTFGPASLQSLPRFTKKPGLLGPSLGEDCLSLNIWSPAADGGRRPVFFWIHGGGFTGGSAKLYPAAHLAEEGDLVTIAVNYRLGVFGFVNFGDLLGDKTISSNLGLRDLIQALRWVRQNISAFGGDPEKITIAGESAGSVAVSMLLISDEAQGLFSGAIMQSGTFSLIHSHAKSLKIASAYADDLGSDAKSLAGLQKLPAERLFAAQLAVGRRFPDTSPAAAWFDGALIPQDLKASQAVKPAPVPLLSGTNHDEISLFALPGPSILPSKREVLAAILQRQFGPAQAESILSAYPHTWRGERQLGTDLCFTMPQIHFTAAHPGPRFLYRFDYKTAFFGAAHALELLFLFDQRSILTAIARGGPLLGVRLRLAQRMRSAWISFVRTGKPGKGWPVFEPDRYATKIFNFQDSLVDDPERERRLLWAGRDIALGTG